MDANQYHRELVYVDLYDWQWPDMNTQQPQAAYYPSMQFQHYNPVNATNPGLAHVPPTRLPFPEPLPVTPVISAPKEPRKRKSKAAPEPKYSARNLFDIVQIAIDIDFFTAKHGEKAKKVAELGIAVRKLGIEGSDGVLKSRLLEVLAFHEDPSGAPAAIVNAIKGSQFEIRLGAPLDLLAAQRRAYEDETDADKDKMLKKAAEDKKGGEAIRNASLHRSRRTTSQMAEESDDDDVVVVEPRNAPPVPAAVPSTPLAPLRARSWSSPHPADLLDYKADCEYDSDIEITAHKPATRENGTTRVVIKAEPAPSTIPAAAKKHVKTETPLASIPRTSGKSSLSKRTKHDDSDIENSPPTPRKTKRVRRKKSFDIESFLLEERNHRGNFETNLLRHVRQGNTEFRKVAESTQAFQTDFLGILRGIFPAQN
ncbi:hypothetical protein B0H13DRAFT_2413619 [Mycena leptocephala]|nr:hypothetical protein B0H13DRAFT_2413619 [Mycena leptocephala]